MGIYIWSLILHIICHMNIIFYILCFCKIDLWNFWPIFTQNWFFFFIPIFLQWRIEMKWLYDIILILKLIFILFYYCNKILWIFYYCISIRRYLEIHFEYLKKNGTAINGRIWRPTYLVFGYVFRMSTSQNNYYNYFFNLYVR